VSGEPSPTLATTTGVSRHHLHTHRAEATAAGVTVLYGERRLWHATATADWWPAAVAARGPRPVSRDNRAEQARLLRSNGTAASAIAAQLQVSKSTVRRDLDRRTPPASGSR
jgi:hypothetical protein